MASDSDEDDFGLTVPPLSVFIKGILQKYPDGCQLKELLQNAEDAGATVVKFLHDKNNYGRNKLFQRNLSCCQGPALCAYNNARFEKCDWKGIQEPQRSHKADSVLKVGKFGIGFNSVYHLTDIPWILSGNKLAVIEPTESLFNGRIRNTVKQRSGFQWILTKLAHRIEMATSSDQFVPIEAVAKTMSGAGFMKQCQFDGSLIRLPFRTAPSALSSTVYDETMVEQLFENFSSEIEEILLFLSHLETIEVWNGNSGVNSAADYRVSISPSSIESVRNKRAQLNQEMDKIVEFRTGGVKIQSDLVMNMTFTIDSDFIYTNESKTWIVSHFVPNHSNAPASWGLENRVKRLPWVSLAAQVETPVEGRIFCFLPLPNNSENMTGLPVHVNAFFGLEDNRRNLKWPSADQMRDSDANWNDALVKEVIPVAYVQLIRFCVENYAVESYKLWPDVDQVHRRWKAILEPFFKLLFDQPVLKISCPGGTWTTLNNKMYIDNLSQNNNEEIAAAVRRCLNQTKTLYVHVPSNILTAMNQYGDKRRLIYIDFMVVSKELKKLRSWNTIGGVDRLLLLQYFVANVVSSALLAYINDFPIIPLVSGAFATLRSTHLYLASETYQNLLPTLSNSIINIKNLPLSVITFLYNTKVSKIKIIDEANFPQLLKQSLPDSWKGDQPINFNLNALTFPNKNWLQQLWKHLQETYPRDLSQFENLKILDCAKNGWTLLPLPSRLFSRLFVENSFSPNIDWLLRHADAIAVPANLLSRHKYLVNYIHKGSASSLAQLLQNCNFSSIKSGLEGPQDAYRNEIVAHFADRIHEITSDDKKLIRKLPLFKILRRPSNNFSLLSVTSIADEADAVAVNFDGLPELAKTDIFYLDSRNQQVDKIRQLLGIRAITREEIANQIVQKRSSYHPNDFSSLMLWAFDYIHLRNVRDHLTNHSFVPSDDGQYHAPSALFDPNVASLQNLFYAETGRFPSGNYTSRTILDTLRSLGLRTTTNLTADEIMRTARLIDSAGFENISKYINNYTIKLTCFDQVLLTNFSKLNSKQIAEMKNLKLFRAKTNRPPDYPKILYWFGSDKQGVLYSANQLANQDCALIVGSVRPIVESTLPIQLGLTDRTNINLDLLSEHLNFVSENYSALNRFEQESMLYQCYKVLAERTKYQVVLPAISVLVWTGQKFVEPKRVVTSWNYYQTGLEPYMYSLPNFLQEDELIQFFRRFGVREEDKLTIGREVFNEIVTDYEYFPITDQREVKIHFNYVRSILEVLAEHLEEDEDLEIPIKHNKIELRFKSASECKFNDCGNYEALLVDCEDDDDIILTHPDLPNELCRKLGATPLSNAVLDAEEFEQHESIIQRLKNILEEYPADATIFQELIQNADDAKAGRVGFLLDMRENAQWRQSVLYKDSGMDKFQGPALWVFNDATFTDEDFKNILSVGGATKRNHSEKIGSFGVGFNCVYHLTDMPSFVSREFLAILDPHKHCLPRTGGIRFNLAKKPRKLESFADQFRPYKGVFDCDLSYKREGVDYSRTLFRLPLRDSEMSATSQLSKNSYDLFKMQNLLKGFGQTVNYVMLFLLNVTRLQVDYLASNRNNPQNKQSLLVVEKSVSPLLNNSGDQNALIQTVKAHILNKQRFMAVHYAELANMSLNSGTDPFCMCETNGASIGRWIAQWSASEDKSYQLAASPEGQEAGLMPVVAIAVNVEVRGNKFNVVKTSGLAFCYLPLPVETGLPFHLHAAFALAANRRHLWTENARVARSLKSRWNEALKTEALVTCFTQLLANLKSLDENEKFQDYKFDYIWPVYDNVPHEFDGFVENVYEKLCKSDASLWKTEDGRWITFAQSRFLKLSNLWSQKFCDAAKRAMKSKFQLFEPECGLVVISPEVQNSLETLFKDEFNAKSFDDNKFFSYIFFPHIKHYDYDLANEILLEILTNSQAHKQYLKQLLQDTPCIPAGQDGDVRVRPMDLVHSESTIHDLYFESENKFAFGKFRKPEIQKILIAFGMRVTASSEMLLERAETVQVLFHQGLGEEAKTRSKLILNNLIGPHIKDSAYDKFLKIPFLFALSQPHDWTLPWYNSKAASRVYSPQEVFSKNSQNSVCFVAPILDGEGVQSEATVTYQLGCSRHFPSPGLVLDQLRILSSLSPKECTTQQVEVMQDIISDCYKLLQTMLKSASKHLEPLIQDLSTLPVLLFNPTAFVPYRYVCSDHTQENYAPYLYSIKGTAYEKFTDLLLKFGIKQAFSIEDYIGALQQMKEKHGENRLPSDTLQIAVHLCKNISDALGESPANLEGMLVPDEKGILLPVSSLTFWELDMTEIPKSLMADSNICNRKIPRDIALKLGVRIQRDMVAQMFYQPFEFGESFGQHEELTTRIHNILDEYSSDSDVINEMIQNADDAGASEIRFILDQRQLRNDSNLPSENWKHLQGPSLIVRNNKIFEEKDFKGIQNLGLGSKREDPHLTGKFGIGFNTVYRLTDVPMFISNNAVLCVLDPHMDYVPTATTKLPGGKFPLSKKFKATYPSIMLGFEPVDDLQFENSTVFRLPLRRVPSKIADPIKLEELMEMFKKFESEAADLFFFLKNIEKIRISCVDQNGKLTKDLIVVSEMSEGDRKKKSKFLTVLGSKKELAEDETVMYKITVGSNVNLGENKHPKQFKWQILQCLSSMKDELPPEVVKLRETGKLKVSPLVGIAMPLHLNRDNKRTYTTLPLPGSNGLPIHVNGKFMLDQGRKHCHLEGDGSYKKQWNEYLITKVLAPLYIQALEIVKRYVNSEWEKTRSNIGDDIKYQEILVKKYQRYLPTTKNQKPIGIIMMKEIYRLLHKNNLELTFGIKIDNYWRRTLMWLPMSEGIIDTLVEKEEQQPVILSTGLTVNQKKDDKPTESGHIRSILEIVHFPKYHLGFNLVVNEIYSTVEMEPNVITPNAVAEHMKKVEDSKLVLEASEEKLPVEFAKTILNTNMIHFCLKYILNAENVELEDIPLLLTADGNLRRFSADYEVYGASNAKLLPSQGKLFCSWPVNFHNTPKKYCREFDVAVLAKHLHNELPDLFGECQKKPRPKQMDLKLIYNIFEYLAKDSKNRESVLERVQPLQDWALLPVTVLDARKTAKNFLVTLRHASIVVFPAVVPVGDIKLQELYRCLRKLGVMFTDVNDFLASFSKDDFLNVRSMLIDFFSYLCACLQSPETIVNVLNSALSNEVQEADFNRLDDKEKEVLLDFIIESFSKPIEANETHTMKLIKSLPLFPTLEGNFINLVAECNYITCTKKIEGAELDRLKDLSNTILLKKKLNKHEQFCKNLNISVMSDIDLYATYIIPNMAKFSVKSIFKHLDCLRRLHWSNERDTLYKQLGRTPVLRMNNGQYKAIANLYSDSIKRMFVTMIPEDEFLPEEFSQLLNDKENESTEWHYFLQTLGLKGELSANTFIQLAKNLESEHSDKETLESKSKILVDYLSMNYHGMQYKFKSFMSQVSSIRFIYSHIIPDTLGFLHQQTLDSNGLVCFRNSVLCQNERVCWTVSKLLPQWSVSHSLTYEIKDLGYLEQPTVEDVTTHTEKICKRLQKLKFEENTTTNINGVEEIQLLREVLEEIYIFLKDKLDQKSHLVDVLKKVPCVLVENGRALVCADQVVFQSPNIDECPPFLYNLPPTLYSFLEVLQKIGTEKLVTHRHYSSALKMFHTTYGEGPIINPNVRQSLENCYVGFLKKLIKNEAKGGAILSVIEEELYLPDEHFCLVKSTQIIVEVGKIDRDLLAKMDGKKWNTAMISEMDESISTVAKALLHLPTLIRPKSSDHYITKTLSHNCEKCGPTTPEKFCQDKYDIQRLFHDSMFVRVVTKVINCHSLHSEDRNAMQDEMAAFFNDVIVSCYAILKIARREKGTNKLLDETSVATYWHKTESNTVDFMVAHEHTNMKTEFVDNLVAMVNSVCPFKSDETASHFRSIFDRLNLYRQNDSLQEIASRELPDGDVESDYRPQLGTIVPDDVLGLRDQNPFNYYKPLEYIAYPAEPETAELEKDDHEVYIYGRIIEKIEETDNDGSLKCRYKVDVGGTKPVEKTALDIYKFISNKQLNREIQKQFPDLILVCSDSQDDSGIDSLSRPMQEIMDEISDRIEEIWRTLAPADRQRAIRRLYLQWHPDKHPDHKDVCEEACKFLQNEVRRLESGLPRKKRDEAKPSEFWDGNFGRWDNRARRDRNRRRNYNRRARDNWEYFSAPRSSDVPPSFAKSLNPAAKLWCQQAEFDFESATSEASGAEPSVEWIFYKCYQVARKCLIALLFTKAPFENQSTNLMELTMDVLEAFGRDPGDVHESVKFLVSKEVDEVHPLKPLCGRTNHHNYLQYKECCKEVLGKANKLLNVAQRCTNIKTSGNEE